jgi:hypothetical protein
MKKKTIYQYMVAGAYYTAADIKALMWRDKRRLSESTISREMRRMTERGTLKPKEFANKESNGTHKRWRKVKQGVV